MSSRNVNWYRSLPAARAQVPCGGGTHALCWEAGALTLPAHPDVEAELVLGALGGDKPRCVAIAETWDRHLTDLEVLAAGPRDAADPVTMGWDKADHSELFDLLARAPLLPGTPRQPGTPGGLYGGPSARTVTVRVASRGGGRTTRPSTSGSGRIVGSMLTAELASRLRARVEVSELLALGSAFQFRLAGAVAAAWAGDGRAAERAVRRPELTAALTGRLAPAAHSWLGIDPGAVLAIPHEGAGWGTLEVRGSGPGRRLRAALPAGWLADVWACGLAVVGGHLVVATEEPGWPTARVLALPEPGADPVPLTVEAADEGGNLPQWAISHAG